MDEAIFDNPYVQTAVPIAMGIAAASSPAGARGASALLTTLGTFQQFSGQRLKKELANRPQFQEVGVDKEPMNRDPRTGELVPVNVPGSNLGLRLKALQQIRQEPTGASPVPTSAPSTAPAPAQQGRLNVTLSRPEGVTFPPDVERQIVAAEAAAQPALQQAQTQAPQTPSQAMKEPPAHWDPELQKMWRLSQTEEGQYLIAVAGGRETMKRYTENKTRFKQEVDTAILKQAALMPGAVEEERQKMEARYPYQRAISEAQGLQAAQTAAGVQRAQRTEKLEALKPLTIRESRRAGIAPDLTDRQYFDIATAKTLPEGMKLTEAERLEDQGLVKSTSLPLEIKELHALRQIAPLVKSMMDDTRKVWGPGGIFENLKPEERALGAAKGGWARLFQTRSELVKYKKDIQSKSTIIAKAAQEAKGTQTEGDIGRTITGLPEATGIPDTQEVAYAVMNSLAQIVNDRFGSLFGKDGYQYPGLTYLQVAPQATVPTQTPAQSPYQEPLSPEGQKALDAIRQQRRQP